MNEQIIKKLQQRYSKNYAHGFDKFIEQNKDLKQALEEMVNQIPWFENIKNAFIAIGHNIYDVVKCKNCGNPLKVENAIHGHHFYCCKKCADNSEYSKKLRQKTCLEKYGSTTPLLNDECKKKTIKTCQEKYGNDMFAGSEQYKKRVPTPFLKQQNHIKGKETKIKKYGQNYGKIIFEKSRNNIQKTNIKKYGVPYVLMNKIKANETHQVMKQKYGKQYFFGTQQSVKYRYNTGFNKIQWFKDYVIPLFTIDEYNGQDKIYRWKCIRCGNEFQQCIHFTGLGDNRMTPRCEKCFPNHASSIEQKHILSFIKEIYTGEILINNKSLISPYELDIVIPEHKLAIQFNGIYWHSEQQGKDRYYHLNKTISCQKIGYRLIHIWQDDWCNDQAMIKQKLRNVFNHNEKIEGEVLDRCWYSILQFKDYEILPPELIKRQKTSIWNCGYIKRICKP